MIKPSDFLDAFDKTADIINIWTDFRRQGIIDEILWLDQNYENIDALRGYILKHVDFKNKIANEDYARKVLGYSDTKIQQFAEFWANCLYAELRNVQSGKIDNKPLKIIVHELKARGR